MPTRIRVRDKDGNIYTVLDERLPKTGKVKVRDQYGYAREITVRGLKRISDDEPGSVLNFGDKAN